MAHRGLPEHGPWWRLGRDFARLAVLLGLFCVLYIVGDMLFYGHVNW
jgi:hypothetical protein